MGLDDMVESRVAVEGKMLVVGIGDADAQQGEEDPHVWLYPDGIAGIARAARDAYTKLDPDHAALYAESCMKIEAELRETEERVREILAPWKGRRFYVQHDAFAHYASYFGLEQVALEEHDKDPGAARIAELVRMARADGVKVLYAQQGHNPAPLRVMAGPLGAFVVSLDPLYPDPVHGLLVHARKLADGFAQERAR
jgi:ABC-type Zn uptake system ZnuABC Zn-binding protein ZnuA